MNLIDLERELDNLYIDLEEVRAYRNLQNTAFDFGSGLITNDSTVSDDAYYEMQEQEILKSIDNIEYIMREMVLRNEEELYYIPQIRYNRYNKNRISKKKLNALKDKGIYAVSFKEHDGKKYLTRFYLSGRKKFAKKQTNKIIRKSRNNFNLRGGGYRKKFDYKWTVY